MSAEVVVLDYGAGNLASLVSALGREAIGCHVADDAREVPARGALILPGVGHFAAAKKELVARGLWDVLSCALGDGRAVLGICLGLQLLAEGSDEAPGEAGLGAFGGRCTLLPDTVKVPHMGFSEVAAARLPAFAAAPPRYLYFVHSYALPLGPETALSATHGVPFSAACARDAVFGFQAHPERSGREGQAYLGAVVRGLAALEAVR